MVAVSQHGQAAMQLSTAADLSLSNACGCMHVQPCSMHVYVYMESLSVLNVCTDCTEVEFVGFSVTSERSYQIDVLMFSSVFDERAISAQATSPPIIIATAHTVCKNNMWILD